MMEHIKIKNALNFYSFANNLKEENTFDKNETIANHIYGSLILAIAINSEFSVTKELGKVIRMIALSDVEKLDTKKFFDMVMNLEEGPKYYSEVYEKKQNYTKEAQLALKCQNLDTKLTAILSENPNISLEQLYNLVVSAGIIKPTNNWEVERYQEVLRFYQHNHSLKHKNRSGWDKTHWNVKSTRIEKIAEHVYGTIILSLVLNSEFDFKVEIDEVLETLVVHEIGEILIGDITPFDNITPEQKAQIEHQAMSKVLGNLSIREKLLKQLVAFDNKSNKNAQFALWCDKLEADLQSKIYQERNLHHSLDDNPDNIVLKSSRVQEMINNGAQTAFDIWYEWDKDKFAESPILIKTLRYVKENKITY